MSLWFVIYGIDTAHFCIFGPGKVSAGQMTLNQESEETKLVDSPDKAEKTDIPLTVIDSWLFLSIHALLF